MSAIYYWCLELETHLQQSLIMVDDRYNGLRKLRKGVQQVVIMHRMKRVKTQLASTFFHLSTDIELCVPFKKVLYFFWYRFGKHCRPSGTRLLVNSCTVRFFTKARKCTQQFVPSFASANTPVCVGRWKRDTVSKGA